MVLTEGCFFKPLCLINLIKFNLCKVGFACISHAHPCCVKGENLLYLGNYSQLINFNNILFSRFKFFLPV